MEIDLATLFDTFLSESEETLLEMEEALLVLERQPEEEEALATVFRVVHNFKGNAAVLGFDGVTELAHRLEDLLDRLRAGELAVNTDLITLMLEGVDGLRQLVGRAVISG